MGNYRWSLSVEIKPQDVRTKLCLSGVASNVVGTWQMLAEGFLFRFHLSVAVFFFLNQSKTERTIICRLWSSSAYTFVCHIISYSTSSMQLWDLTCCQWTSVLTQRQCLCLGFNFIHHPCSACSLSSVSSLHPYSRLWCALNFIVKIDYLLLRSLKTNIAAFMMSNVTKGKLLYTGVAKNGCNFGLAILTLRYVFMLPPDL